MVTKLCAVCGSYFSGELNGNYCCPRCSCRDDRQRRLDALDYLDQPMGLERPQATTGRDQAA